MQKEHNILLEHYKTIRWRMCSSFSLCIHHYLSIQTLTTLNLGRNNIGAAEAQHLARALQNNTVKDVYFFRTTYSSLCFNTDADHTPSWRQPNWCRRSTTSCSSNTKQYGEGSVLLFHYVFIIIFSTDTHHAQSLHHQNRCWRSTTSSSGITKQHGKRRVLLFHYVFQQYHISRISGMLEMQREMLDMPN